MTPVNQPTPWEAVLFIVVFCFVYPTIAFLVGVQIGRFRRDKIIENELDKKARDSIDNMYKVISEAKSWCDAQIEKTKG